jgi:membrane protease YdiL (CAAX protease family)
VKTQSSNRQTKILSFFAAFLAVLLFVPLFAFRRIGGFDFWWWMSLNVGAVVLFALLSNKPYWNLILNDFRQGLWKKIGLGVLSAVLLYAVFQIGNEGVRFFSPSAGSSISQVYGFKGHVSTLRIVLLMTVLIGPGEEIFWRGYLQRIWAERLGKAGGYILVVILYALVHAASGNIILVLAAGVCGLFWGFLYLRYRSVVLVCISHTLWDLMIFVIRPVGA